MESAARKKMVPNYIVKKSEILMMTSTDIGNPQCVLCLTNLRSENKHVKHLQPKKERGEGLLDSVNNHQSAFINKLPFLTIVFCFIELTICE